MQDRRAPIAVLAVLVLLFSTFQLSMAQPDQKALDKYFNKARKDWNVPGYSIAIVKDGQVVFEKGYGVLEIGKTKKVDENTLYAIASNTKAFLSASLAHLVWEGKLNWDDKVVDHLPYFQLYDPYATREATIEDLLSHRLGLGTFSGDVIWYKSTYTAEQVIKRARHVPQAYSFRAGYGYSNLMFITAGEVLKSVTGMPWSEFVQKHIFQPLHMDRSVTSTTSLQGMNNVATPHKTIDGKPTPIAWTNWDNMGAAGGIISSVDDMAKWMILQMNQGINNGDTLFSPKVQVDMWTPHNNHRLSLAAQKNNPTRHFSAYGLGWGISDYQGKMMVSHGGGYDGMYSRVAMIPEEHLGVVVLTNSMSGISTPIAMRAIDEYLGTGDRDWSAESLESAARRAKFKEDRVSKRIAARESGTKPTVSEDAFIGNYYDPMYGAVEVIRENGNLVIDFKPAPQLKADLSHWHYNTYKLNWREEHAWFGFGTIKFVINNNNAVEGIEFDVPNDDIFFHEIHLKKMN